ncbi:MAG: sigma-70 family RNA polymerase sigma factor [Myxococcales bacterium]|nr:sigma-70 family RNA polymerase sigma factor [Myxococcales bacterium]
MLSDEALFEALLKGDERAFDVLYERYERPLFGFLLRHAGDAHEAEDALHEAFLAVLKEGKGGRPKVSFRAWLFQVARNACLNRARSRNRGASALEHVAQAAPSMDAGPEPVLEAKQAAAVLRGALARLPATLSELYELRASGLSYDEAAHVLAVPVGTVKSRMHELVRRLREEMAR